MAEREVELNEVLQGKIAEIDVISESSPHLKITPVIYSDRMPVIRIEPKEGYKLYKSVDNTFVKNVEELQTFIEQSLIISEDE